MKRLRLLFIVCSCVLLTGCSRAENIHIYGRNSFKDTSTDIQIDEKYTLKDYQKEYTEDGCVVTINYEIMTEDSK
ncbi:MAG: hypothetical protein HDR13_00740 [Lachnospiraceae bacterium]|nr:hypothetical protein [Lachnospiraceae bacterium]